MKLDLVWTIKKWYALESFKKCMNIRELDEITKINKSFVN